VSQGGLRCWIEVLGGRYPAHSLVLGTLPILCSFSLSPCVTFVLFCNKHSCIPESIMKAFQRVRVP
jgi:hypothetical protein